MKIKVLFSIILIALTFVSFETVRHHEFLGMDDHIYIWNNDVVQQGLSWEGVKWAFCADLCFPSSQADYWQPMTFLSRMIDVQLFGMDSGAHHIMNLVFHVFNVLLVFFIFGSLTKRWMESFVLAALFGVHPMVAEVTGWVTARKDVLSVFFGFMCMWFFACAPKKWGVWRIIMMALMFGASLLAKPMMITLPAILWLMSIWPVQSIRLDQFWKGSLEFFRKYWPMWLVALAYIPIPFLGQPQAIEYDLNAPWAKALESYLFYIIKIFYPTSLALYGPIPETPIPWIHIVAAIIVLAIKTGWFLHKRNTLPFLAFGWFWFLITSLPIIALQWKADRFVYLPKLGLLVIAIWGIAHLAECYLSKLAWVRIIPFVAAIAVCVVLSREQIQYWHSDQTVMERALEHDHNNYAAHNVLSVWYGQRGDLELAEKHALDAIDIYPERSKPWGNLGQIRMAQQRYSEARDVFQRALKLEPGDYQNIVNLGNAFLYLEQHDQALGAYQTALRIRPEEKEIYRNIAILYKQQGNITEAKRAFEQSQ